MDRTERVYRINQLLTERPSASFEQLRGRLGVSRATLHRDLGFLRDRMHAPIVFDRVSAAYRLERATVASGGQYELPGLWFNADEIHALLTMQHLLAHIDPVGLLGPHVKPLEQRLQLLLTSAERPNEEIRKRVRIIGLAARRMILDHFATVGSALLRRKRLAIVYYARPKDEETRREVSPQRLVHYRDNWYLDAWCHWRKALRSFAVDSIRAAEILDAKARDVAERTLDEVLGAGYGIFTGRRTIRARLRFAPERARWVATERWHPRQKGRFAKDGSWLLEVPYSDHRELLMDILRHGAEVEVLAPPALRAAVAAEAGRIVARYAGE